MSGDDVAVSVDQNGTVETELDNTRGQPSKLLLGVATGVVIIGLELAKGPMNDNRQVAIDLDGAS